jgi:hypothetical protein
MFHNLTNTLKDLLGTNKVITLRIFKERKWTPPNPMFNVLEVEPGMETTFVQFLNEAQNLSGKLKSPISLGPYKVDGLPIYIYTTHYDSTWKYLLVMLGLFFTRIAAKRSKATKTTSWTYCEFTGSPELPSLDSIYILGIKGAKDPFLDFMRAHNATLAAETSFPSTQTVPNPLPNPAVSSINRMIYNARGKARGDYYFALGATPDNYALIQQYASGGGAFFFYEGTRIPRS